MARIVNVSKVEIARSTTDPNASTRRSLIENIQGNLALVDDLSTTAGVLDTCPIGIPYQCFGPGNLGGTGPTNGPAYFAAMFECPADETEVEIAFNIGNQDTPLIVEIRQADNTLIDSATVRGPDYRVTLSCTEGPRILIVRTQDVFQGNVFQGLSISFPGIGTQAPGVQGDPNDPAHVGSFVDIDDTEAANDLGWSGYHATTMQENLNYLTEYLTDAPAPPNETRTLGTHFDRSTVKIATVPLALQVYGWTDDGEASGVWHAPGLTTIGSWVEGAYIPVHVSDLGSMVVRVLIATTDKNFANSGSDTDVDVRVRVLGEGLGLVSTTTNTVLDWVQVGGADMYYMDIAVTSQDVGPNNLFVEFLGNNLSETPTEDSIRILSVEAHIEN